MGEKKPLSKGLEKSGLSSDDICRLLKAASRAGVKSMHIADGALEVDFYERHEAQALSGSPAGLVSVNEKTSDEITRQALAEDIEALEQTQLEELMIRDPAEYERRIVDGSLVDDPTRREEETDDQ